MSSKYLIATTAAAVCLAMAPYASATAFANSLWIGNDTHAALGILNTDLSGNVLQSIANTGAQGFGVDVADNKLFINETFGAANVFNLTTLAPMGSVTLPGGIVSEDFSFGGGSLWVGDFGGHNIDQVDPVTGSLISSFAVTYSPLGLAYDGSGLWVSEFAAGAPVNHYDLSGNLLSSFTPFPNGFAGGIAFDSLDGTLWIGTGGGQIDHFTTAGVLLGGFNTGDNRFADGLEWEGGAAGVPEPGVLPLFGTGLAALGLIYRRKKTQR